MQSTTERTAATDPAVEHPARALAESWTKLINGETKVTGLHSEGGRYRVELSESRCERPPSDEELGVLNRLVLGDSQKVVAADERCSLSRVAMVAAKCLEHLGLDCVASTVPMPIVMMVYAWHGKGVWSESTGATLLRSESVGWILDVNRPDAGIEEVLTPGESDVIRSLVDGRSYGQIAVLRGTSVRTIANQVARAYFRLNVSGRMELMGRLVTRPFTLRRKFRTSDLGSPHAEPARTDVIAAPLRRVRFPKAETWVTGS